MTSSDLRIGLWGEYDLLTSAEARERLKIADQLGYDSVWFDDATPVDEVTLLGEAVRATERMNIGTAIMSVFTRSPTIIAQTFASLDLLSRGTSNRFRILLASCSKRPMRVSGPSDFFDDIGAPQHTRAFCSLTLRSVELKAERARRTA